MEKEVEISGKKYIVKEITYLQGVGMEKLETEDKIKKILMFSAGLSEEEVKVLSFKDGIELQKVVNEVNGLTVDFQNPTVEEKTS